MSARTKRTVGEKVDVPTIYHIDEDPTWNSGLRRLIVEAFGNRVLYRDFQTVSSFEPFIDQLTSSDIVIFDLRIDMYDPKDAGKVRAIEYLASSFFPGSALVTNLYGGLVFLLHAARKVLTKGPDLWVLSGELREDFVKALVKVGINKSNICDKGLWSHEYIEFISRIAKHMGVASSLREHYTLSTGQPQIMRETLSSAPFLSKEPPQDAAYRLRAKINEKYPVSLPIHMEANMSNIVRVEITGLHAAELDQYVKPDLGILLYMPYADIFPEEKLTVPLPKPGALSVAEFQLIPRRKANTLIPVASENNRELLIILYHEGTIMHTLRLVAQLL